jgi:hypothetical protein
VIAQDGPHIGEWKGKRFELSPVGAAISGTLWVVAVYGLVRLQLAPEQLEHSCSAKWMDSEEENVGSARGLVDGFCLLHPQLG